MRESLTVDVVLCTNRASQYIGDAVRSVREQTYTDWRLILVNDGCSAPAVVEKLEELVRTVPNGIVLHRPPRGLPASRNAGIAAGAGALISFLDDDDIWLPSRLESEVDRLLQEPSAVGVYSAGWFMGSDGERWTGGWLAEPGSRRELLSGQVPLPRIVSLTVRRSALARTGGFNPVYGLGEDIDFILRLLMQGRLVANPLEVVGYRRHALNMTNAPRREQHEAIEAILDNLIQGEARSGREEARLLQEYLRRYRREASRASVGAFAEAVRAGDLLRGGREVLWGLTHAPGEVLGGVSNRVGGRLKRAGRRKGSTG